MAFFWRKKKFCKITKKKSCSVPFSTASTVYVKLIQRWAPGEKHSSSIQVNVIHVNVIQNDADYMNKKIHDIIKTVGVDFTRDTNLETIDNEIITVPAVITDLNKSFETKELQLYC